jgi:hypothetical protein
MRARTATRCGCALFPKPAGRSTQLQCGPATTHYLPRQTSRPPLTTRPK